MPFSLLPFFFLLCNSLYLTSTTIIPLHHHHHHHHHRRILHQPFAPLDSFPPTQPPSSSPPPPPQKRPKFPYSSGSNNQPFFPSYPSPPPPPPPIPSTYATFPANISSLIFPQSPHHKPFSPKLVILTVILSFLSISFIVAFAILFYRRRHYSSSSSSFTTGKTSRSDSHRLFPANTAPSDSQHHNVRGISATSSEFLYLGTLVNSRGIDGDADGSSAGAGARPNRKLGSPELHPLPPLSRQNFSQSFGNAKDVSSENEEEEEFYSPRGSIGSKDSPVVTGSSSRRTFQAVVGENFESMSSSSSSNSRTASYPSSNLASRSPSPSPPVSISSRSSSSKSPEFVPKLPPPPPPRPSPPSLTPSSPPGESSKNMSSPGRKSLEKNTESPARNSSEKNPHSPARSSVDMNSLSPARNSNVSLQKPQSLERNSDTCQRNPQSPPKIGNISRQPASIPPPPPPPPSHRFWVAPIHPQPIREPVGLPPELDVPSRLVGFQMPTAPSPAEFTHNLDFGEKSEETQKPKLKPLHWDKVRASSDRAMVWDQLKSSSFQ